MRKLVYLCVISSFVIILTSLFASCTDYKKDIVGWWISCDKNFNPERTGSYVYYIIREDGTYKIRRKGSFMGSEWDDTERGNWSISGSKITFTDKKDGRTHKRQIEFIEKDKIIMIAYDSKDEEFYYVRYD